MSEAQEPADLPDLPMEHVQRPQPPWRAARLLTGCGRPVDGMTIITREQLLAKVKRQGQQRAAFTTCMVCWDKSRSNHSWEADPVNCLMREASRYAVSSARIMYGGYYDMADPSEKAQDAIQFRNELLAIAALIEAHQDEFDEFCDGLASTSDLTAKRKARLAAERHAKGSRR